MQYVSGYLVYLETEEGKGIKSIAAYRGDLKRFRRWLDNEGQEGGRVLTWEQIGARHVRAYIAWLSSDRVVIRDNGKAYRAKKVGPKYIRRVNASLRKFYDYLVRVEKLLDENPLRDIKNPKLPHRKPPHLTTDELRRLIQTALDYSHIPERIRNWAMVAFLFHTGLRVSEFCAMRESDIRYRDGFPQSLRVIGKGDKERRVSLSTEGSRALHQWMGERSKVLRSLPPGKENLDFVWLIPNGARRGEVLTPNGVRHTLRRLGKLAGITHSVHPHKLRHSYGTEAVRNGAKVHGIMESMGHSSLQVTGQYLHADESELEQVAAIMPSVL